MHLSGVWLKTINPPKPLGRHPKAAARSRADGQISAGSDPDAGGEVGVVQPGDPGAW